MAAKIDRDQGRFRQIVRGKIRQNLRKYVTSGEMIGRQGKDLVSIPLPRLDVPHFRYGDNGAGGVGQGEGDIGDPIARGDQPGNGQAGSDPGEHLLEVEVSLEELAQILGEELALPRIEPRGKANLEQAKAKYSGIRRTGPESLRHVRRSYKQALRREIASGTYNPARPHVVPLKEDRRYRSWKDVPLPVANAVVFYLMDVSGSMTDAQKEIVRTEAFWIDAWLKTQYQGLEIRYLIHDAAARVVDEHTFYHTRESGGTRISSAYKLFDELVSRDFPPAEWNIYAFHFSDGDNWGEDNRVCLDLLRERILTYVNQFSYGQVESPYGSGEFLRTLREAFGDGQERLVLSEIRDREAIFDSIREFLGRGH